MTYMGTMDTMGRYKCQQCGTFGHDVEGKPGELVLCDKCRRSEGEE